MDKTQVVKWGVWAVARGVAWVLAAKLGFSAVEAGASAEAIASGLGAVALAILSVYTSVKGRKAVAAEAKALEAQKE